MLRNLCFIIFSTLLSLLLSCVSPFTTAPSPTWTSSSAGTRPPIAKEEPKSDAASKAPAARRTFHQVVQLSIPLNLPDTSGSLNAEVYRPEKKIVPKTLFVIVPGSGNISHKGEVAGDGVDTYPEPIELHSLWARTLADKGYFVLTYDKRTCVKKVNSICQNNSQKDIESEGIVALARDLDQVYRFVKSKLDNEPVRLILLSSTQGAQVVSLSESAKEASGIILLSPIIGDLEEMWVGGLDRALQQTQHFNRKNRLANEKESMKGFFTSFKAGRFPDTAQIRGASAIFWRTWMEASLKTPAKLGELNRPILALFSDKDVFSSSEMKEQFKKATHKNFQIKSFSSYDRNFIQDKSLPEPVVSELTKFVESLSTKAL